jgi:hypothetical protein
LIEMAKSVQRQTPAPAVSQPLDQLRAAIGRVDEQLIRELRRSPPTAASSWQSILDRNLGALAIDRPLIAQLANALVLQ